MGPTRTRSQSPRESQRPQSKGGEKIHTILVLSQLNLPRQAGAPVCAVCSCRTRLPPGVSAPLLTPEHRAAPHGVGPGKWGPPGATAARAASHAGQKRRHRCHLHRRQCMPPCGQGTPGTGTEPHCQPAVGHNHPSPRPPPQPPCGSGAGVASASQGGAGSRRSRTKGWQPFLAQRGAAGRAGGAPALPPPRQHAPLGAGQQSSDGDIPVAFGPSPAASSAGSGQPGEGTCGEQPCWGIPPLPAQRRPSHPPGSGTDKMRNQHPPRPHSPQGNHTGNPGEDAAAAEPTTATRKAAESNIKPFLSGKEPTYQTARHSTARVGRCVTPTQLPAATAPRQAGACPPGSPPPAGVR